MSGAPPDPTIAVLQQIAEGIQRLAVVAEAILAERQRPKPVQEPEPRRVQWLGADPPQT